MYRLHSGRPVFSEANTHIVIGVFTTTAAVACGYVQQLCLPQNTTHMIFKVHFTAVVHIQSSRNHLHGRDWACLSPLKKRRNLAHVLLVLVFTWNIRICQDTYCCTTESITHGLSPTASSCTASIRIGTASCKNAYDILYRSTGSITLSHTPAREQHKLPKTRLLWKQPTQAHPGTPGHTRAQTHTRTRPRFYSRKVRCTSHFVCSTYRYPAVLLNILRLEKI